ncbi:MAG: rhamnogalacturonan acetylesterase [Ferruginibacter sp.]|jgi:lysophospholipase L1-like esterase
MKTFILPLLLFLIVSFGLPVKKKIKIFLAGDSTIAIKETKVFPETGWGMPFVHFWDSTVSVVNRAKNGRSTKSFMQEGLWKSITDEAGEGDYVFIQFGHNDEVATKKTYTTETEFKNYLVQYIQESRNKKAIPVLITPVARRKFDSLANSVGTHNVYAQIVRDVANTEAVPLIDLDKIAQQLYQQMGEEKSKLLFNYLAPGEHPNYPEGKKDDTHFNELGARKIAEIVLAEIRKLLPELAESIYVPIAKK